MLLLLFIIPFANAQEIIYPQKNDSSIIQIKAFYKGYGKVFVGNSDANKDIFGNEYPNYIVKDYKKDKKLKQDEIIKAELLLFENYNKLYSQDTRFSNDFIAVKDPVKYLRYYYRQYIGFFNDKDEILVLIHLMNFGNKKMAKYYFKYWNKNFSIGFGDFYGKNQKTFLVNLTKNEIKFY